MALVPPHDRRTPGFLNRALSYREGDMAPAADEPPWGEALTILRLIRRWTQTELADAVSLSFSAISRYEAGNRPLPPELQRQLVLAMGFPPYAFERTVSFVRWARAARLSALAAGRAPASIRIDLLEAEAGLWMEDLVRGVLTDVLADPSLPTPTPAAQPSPPGWQETLAAP